MFRHTNTFSSFSVDDLQKAKQFYEKILGLAIKDNPMGIIEIHLDNGRRVMVYPKNDHQPATYTVLNFIVSDIEKAVDELSALGVVFEQYTGPIATNEKGISRGNGGPSIAWFKDPAGNIFSVLEENTGTA